MFTIETRVNSWAGLRPHLKHRNTVKLYFTERVSSTSSQPLGSMLNIRCDALKESFEKCTSFLRIVLYEKTSLKTVRF